MQPIRNITIIARRYCEGEAWTNRMLAYARGFVENGCHVKLVFLITDEKRTPYTINIPGVEVVNLWESDNCIVRIHRGLSYLRNKRRIKSVMEDGDTCLMFDGGGFYLNEILASGKDVKVMYEITEHPFILDHTDYKEENLRKQLKQYENLDKLIVISKSLYDFFLTQGFPAEKLQIVNMFVDLKRFEGVQKTTNEKYIAYCGTVSYDKDGADVLIQVFAKFHLQFPEYRLKIIGRGMTPDVIPQLTQLAEKCGVKDSVEFTGRIPASEMPQLLMNASILALARPDNLQNANGFPTKLGEYLATGNPVVATKVGNIPVFLTDGINCRLAKAGNVDDFAEKLIWVASHIVEAHSLAQQGKMLAETVFSNVKQTKNILE